MPRVLNEILHAMRLLIRFTLLLSHKRCFYSFLLLLYLPSGVMLVIQFVYATLASLLLFFFFAFTKEVVALFIK